MLDYAPIEQYDSQRNQWPWTDIYALGAMSYTTLTDVTSLYATGRVMDDKLQPLNQLNPTQSPVLATAIEWSLGVRPNERPQSTEVRQTSLQDTGTIPKPQFEADPVDLSKACKAVEDSASTIRRTTNKVKLSEFLMLRLVVVEAWQFWELCGDTALIPVVRNRNRGTTANRDDKTDLALAWKSLKLNAT